jgi:signal transduction histidine kinase
VDAITPPPTPANKLLARVCAILVFAGGSISALGWILNVHRLTDWDNNGITIKFNASICVILISIGVFLATYYPQFPYVVRTLGALAVLIAGATFSQTLLGIDLHIDTLLFSEAPGTVGTVAPGRMGPPASVSFVLLGAALILATFRRWRSIGAVLSVASLFIATLSVVGYIFGANQLYSVPRLTGIALQTATMIAILSIGAASSIPEHGIAASILRKDSGGVMLRRTLPLFLIIIFGIGTLLLSGILWGYYDPAFGTAMRTLFEIVMFTAVLWWTAEHVARTERLSVEAHDAASKNEMYRQIAQTQEVERKRLARDLHDHVGQQVTALRFALTRLCKEKADATELVREIKMICGEMEKLDAEVSILAWQMRPPVLDDDGMVAAIRRLGGEWSANHGITLELHAAHNLPRLSEDIETNLYRIVQESLNNVAKHAKATRVGITLDVGDEETMRLIIEDDGAGFPDLRTSSACNAGFGLVGMRERAALIGGSLEIESAPGDGATIFVKIPSNAPAKPKSPAPQLAVAG